MPSAVDQKALGHVTIIGAGLSGLSLALALHDRDIKVEIHEARKSSYNLGGAIMLSPNALRVLDHLGRDSESVFKRVASKGFHFDQLSFLNEQHELKDVYYFGHEKLYGYRGFRIYRQILIDEMADMVKERNIPIHYESKYSHVVSEDSASGVLFALANGQQLHTDALIGCDGIHSRVRSYITGDGHTDATQPKFGGLLAITSHIPTHALRMPTAHYPLPATVQGKTGAFVITPQDVDGSECLVGTQRPHPALDRQGWADLAADKAKLVEMMTASKDSWNDLVQSAMEEVTAHPERVNIWPYHTIPKLESWQSTQGRVLIIGDAAHAIPPSAGQGVNQAFEDAFALAVVLSQVPGRRRRGAAARGAEVLAGLAPGEGRQGEWADGGDEQ